MARIFPPGAREFEDRLAVSPGLSCEQAKREVSKITSSASLYYRRGVGRDIKFTKDAYIAVTFRNVTLAMLEAWGIPRALLFRRRSRLSLSLELRHLWRWVID